MERSDERNEFLADLLVTAIESGTLGSWMDVQDYHVPEDEPEAGWFADIREAAWAADDPDGPEEWHVDLDLIAHGIGVIRDAVFKPVEDWDGNTVEVLHNTSTGERLHVSGSQRRRILEASRENDAGLLDALDALAVLECACYGRVVFG
jgi:hypothetical protein